MSELSKALIELHESGDVGRAVEGYSEIAKAMEEEITQLRQQLAEAEALVLEEAAGYQNDIEAYHQRALRAEVDYQHPFHNVADNPFSNVSAQLEAGEAVAEVIPNVVGVEIAWVDPWNKAPVGTKLYTHPAPVVPEYDAADLEVTAWPEQQVGMHVGMVKGVKIKQKSTGIEVCCDAERSQHRNRDKCIKMLSAAQE